MKILTGYTFLFLAVLAGCVFSSEYTCPDLEDIYPCICALYRGNITVACPVLRIPYPMGTLKRLLRNLLGKRDVSLTLSNFDLNEIPSTLFSGVGIRTLRFEDCYIESLNDQDGPAFSGLENTLDELSFKNSLDESLPTSLHHLRKLRSVTFAFHKPTTFSNKWFGRGLDSVEELHILGKGLRGFEDRSASTLTNLKEFTLSETKLKTVQRSLLPDPALRLEELDLSENSLTSLPKDIFSNMPALKRVNVYRNKITRLDQSAWEPVWEQLEFFNILRNPLVCDSTIDWIFSLRKPASVNGKCEEPAENRNLQLNQLYRKKKKETF